MTFRSLLFVLASTFNTLAMGSALKADGIVRVLGGDRVQISLTLIPEFSDAYPVPEKGGRFFIELPYHAQYLLRAEAPGCVTKEVLFDVNLPPAKDDVERHFPLEITLEKMPEGAPYRYAGPVGLVSYDEASQDFMYTTEYHRIYEHASAVTAMHRKEGRIDDGAWASGTTLLKPVGDPLAELLPSLRTGWASLADHDNATPPAGARRVGSRDANNVHRSSALNPPTPPTPPTLGGLPDQRSTVLKAVDDVEPSIGRMDEGRTEARSIVADPLDPPVATPSQEGSHAWLSMGSPDLDCGTTENMRTTRCSVTVHRLRTATGCDELRKAEHVYGAVFYFHNGRPITERHYLDLLKEHLAN